MAGALGFALVAMAVISPLVSSNSEGDALVTFRRSLSDPDNVLQSWDPTLVNPCTWFHVTCNQDNRVTRVKSSSIPEELLPAKWEPKALLSEINNADLIRCFHMGNEILKTCEGWSSQDLSHKKKLERFILEKTRLLSDAICFRGYIND